MQNKRKISFNLNFKKEDEINLLIKINLYIFVLITNIGEKLKLILYVKRI